MNQKIKKLLALLLALMMIFALAACGNDAGNYEDDNDDHDDNKEDSSQSEEKINNQEGDSEGVQSHEDLLLGNWVISTNISNQLNTSIAQSLGSSDLSSDVEIYLLMSMDFSQDGQFTFGFGCDEYSVNGYIADLKQKILEDMYQTAGAEGVDKETLDQQVQSEYGMSLDAYVGGILEDAVQTMMEGFASANFSGYYESDIVNGKIYIEKKQSKLSESSDYITYALDGDTLVIQDMTQEGKSVAETMAQLGFQLPWQMERQ